MILAETRSLCEPAHPIGHRQFGQELALLRLLAKSLTGAGMGFYNWLPASILRIEKHLPCTKIHSQDIFLTYRYFEIEEIGAHADIQPAR